MRIGSRLRSSLSARISLWTVLFAAIVFIISISVVAYSFAIIKYITA